MKTTANMTETGSKKIVGYYRVSTRKQGLGLEAQRDRVHQYAEENGLEVVAEFEEKQSGKGNEFTRPMLIKAMATARQLNAVLTVAKADRLSRDLPTASKIFFDKDFNKGLKVVALNMPEEAYTNQLMFGVFYGMANLEAEFISKRTKEGLAAKKKRGEQVGNPNAKFTDEMRMAAANVRKETANNDPANLAAAAELRRFFAGSEKRNLSAAARHLNEKLLYTAGKGVPQTAKSVSLLCQRYAI